VSEPPVALEVVRGDLVESRHRAHLVLLDPAGAVEVECGDTRRPVYPRSSLKPLQAAAMVRAGFAGRGEQLALAAASHDGEPRHLAVVRSVLAAAGVNESQLQCPPALPRSASAMLAYVAAGGAAAALCHNCSGKHAAMLATCVAAGWDVATYREPHHPLQQRIRAEIEGFCGEPIVATSVDGCGAPAHALSLRGLADGFRRVATAGPGPAAEVREAMRAHPVLVGGTGRAVSELIAEVPGLVAKDGAEGVWAAALSDGRGFAAKVEDGAERALGPLLAAVLVHWGLDGDAVERWREVAVLGGGTTVGAIRCTPELRRLLDLPAPPMA
jgi:L-asparaginase II